MKATPTSRNHQEGGEGGEEGALPQLEAEARRSGVGKGGQSPESESSITYSFLRSAQPWSPFSHRAAVAAVRSPSSPSRRSLAQ